MRIFIGSDHGGFALKQPIAAHLRAAGHTVTDVGAHTEDSVDYPGIALQVAFAVSSGDADFGVLVCGTGIGMAIAANKVPRIRAANVTSVEFAELARRHNNANVVTLAGRFTAEDDALAIVDAFLGTPFDGGRHARRVDAIGEAEGCGGGGATDA